VSKTFTSLNFNIHVWVFPFWVLESCKVLNLLDKSISSKTWFKLNPQNVSLERFLNINIKSGFAFFIWRYEIINF